MRKCSVCGRRFRLLAKNRYVVVKPLVGLNNLIQGGVYHNAFDCPHCGCQNIVGVLGKVNTKEFNVEEFKRMMFEQQAESEDTE